MQRQGCVHDAERHGISARYGTKGEPKENEEVLAPAWYTASTLSTTSSTSSTSTQFMMLYLAGEVPHMQKQSLDQVDARVEN